MELHRRRRAPAKISDGNACTKQRTRAQAPDEVTCGDGRMFSLAVKLSLSCTLLKKCRSPVVSPAPLQTIVFLSPELKAALPNIEAHCIFVALLVNFTGLSALSSIIAATYCTEVGHNRLL